MDGPLDLAVLQVARLKGMAASDDIAVAIDRAPEEIAESLSSLVERGFLLEARARYRCTPDGKSTLTDWLQDERNRLDPGAMDALYENFHSFNTELKSLASDWQIRDGEANDHSDDVYDKAILSNLASLHDRFMPLVGRMAEVAPRLKPYAQRFDGALRKVKSGDHNFFLRPIIDSYHTIWFELHEDLIALTGRTRDSEAAAGRAD